MISIVIPVLNEAGAIGPFLAQFERPAAAAEFTPQAGEAEPTAQAELIVVDGGSVDTTVEQARSGLGKCALPGRILTAEANRARQMNLGAGVSSGDTLLFLHVDTFLPSGALGLIELSLTERGVLGGRFRVRMSGRGWQYRLVEAGINFRDRLTGGFTGDQAIFVRREAFAELGGFAEIPLCEDVELVRRLKRKGRLVTVPEPVVTSSRRYEQWGPCRTAVRMWVIKGLYLAGLPAERLAGLYPDVR